ncbi:hypothetical protein H9X57_04895 [Flavobacterium piscinae]|nr:hypothetical protein [Flavobacterium piscinae]
MKWLMHFTATIGVEIFFAISGFLIGKIVYRLIQKTIFRFRMSVNFGNADGLGLYRITTLYYSLTSFYGI